MGLFEVWPAEILRAKGYVAFTDHPPLLVSRVRDQVGVVPLLPPGPADNDDDLVGDDAPAPGWTPGPAANPEELITELIFIGQNIDAAAVAACMASPPTA